ncbi:MAG: sugar-binding domain-containing protein [Carnobacterium sp.]
MLDREDLLLKTAILYYEDAVTQSDIAKKLNISRPTVASLLQEAKEKGIVKISIQHSNLQVMKLQKKLLADYPLKNIKIVPNSQKDIKKAAGKLCAELVEPLLNSISSMGIGWGTTLYEYANEAEYLKFAHLKIIPLIGGIGLSEVRIHSNHLAFMLSEKYHSDVSYFYAPALADTLELKDTLLQTNLVKDVLQEGKQVELAILGIGDPLHSTTYQKLNYITESNLSSLKKAHAVGDIGSTIFTKDGTPITEGFAQRLLGIELSDIKKIPRVVIVATGIEKAESIKALLKLGVITDLIIDEKIAKLL